MNKYSVISISDCGMDTYCDHVHAVNKDAAFMTVAIIRPSAQLVACLDGHLNEDNEITFAGCGPISGAELIEGAEDNHSYKGVMIRLLSDNNFDVLQNDAGMFYWVSGNPCDVVCNGEFDSFSEAADNCIIENNLHIVENLDGSFGNKGE